MKTLRLFGGVSVADPDGSPLPAGVGQRHRLALLALLAVETRGQSRDKLIACLWPERDTKHARNLLSVSVYTLRSALGEDILLSRGDDLILNPGSIRVDVADFEAAIDRREYEAAVDLHDGPFLDGFFLNDSQAFELWTDRQRERLAGKYVKALESLACAAEARHDAQSAVEWWRRRMAHDRFDSRVTLRLMEALDRAGNRAGALEVASSHAELLSEEFGTESGPDVVTLAERLRSAPAARERHDVPTTGEQPDSPAPGAPSLDADIADRNDSDSPAGTGHRKRNRSRTFTVVGGGAVLAILALVLSGGLSWQPRSPTPAPVTPPEPTLAVLPFEVIGTETGLWSEGLVSLLSANLDGIDGLRIIDPQVILTRMAPESGSAGQTDRAATIRNLGLVSGASYVLEGSLVGSAGSVRLTARVRSIDSGEELGSFSVEGTPDSILAMVDRVSLDVVRMMLAKAPGKSQQPGLARIITLSLPALKEYLAGEQEFRRLRWEAAVGHYNEAVELDSTFALALYRLSLAHGWLSSSTLFREYSERAMALRDRLSERERLLLTGQLQVAFGRKEAVRTFRRLVSTYPGNVEGWYGLGEALTHTGNFGSSDEAIVAFRRTLELDPRYAPARIHLLSSAIEHGDTLSAREIVSRQVELDPESPETAGFRLAEELAFGDSAVRARAHDELRTTSGSSLRRARDLLSNSPDQSASLMAVIQAQLEGGFSGPSLVVARLAREGRIAEARRTRDRLMGESALLDAVWHLHGHENPDGRGIIKQLRSELAAGGRGAPYAQFMLGALAADSADWEAADSIATLLQIPRPGGAAQDSIAVQNTTALGLLLSAYLELRRGSDVIPAEIEAAMSGLDVNGGPAWIGNYVHNLVFYTAGRMLQERGDPSGALVQYESMVDLSFIGPPEVEFHLARVYEDLGRPQEAITRYDRFLRWTTRADPEYAPLRREAAAALRRLQ